MVQYAVLFLGTLGTGDLEGLKVVGDDEGEVVVVRVGVVGQNVRKVGVVFSTSN